MSYPINHEAELHALCVEQLSQEASARFIGAAAMRLEDEHQDLMTTLSGSSVRRLAERRPCLCLAAIHRALGWR